MDKRAIGLLLVLLIFIETMCYTYLLQTKLYYSLSVVYFLAGFGICFLPLFLKPEHTPPGKTNYFVPLIFGAVLVALTLINLPQRFAVVPIDYHLADMLPRIKIYVTRFLNGQYVYDDVKEIWGGNLPPYFPATWEPFIPSVIWNFDMRWTPVVAFIGAVIAMLMLAKRGADRITNALVLFLLVSLFFLFNYHACHETEFWTMSYEGLIGAYYIALCLAIIAWNPYLIGLAISLCLLSRFALAFWVPVFILFAWWKESFQFAAKITAVTAALVLGLFIIPFVIGHTDVFLKTLGQYQVISQSFWRWNNIDNGGYNQVGLYKFFNSSQILLIRKIQLVTTLLAPVVFIALAVKRFDFNRKKKIIVGLGSLKFTLLFFFNFIEMPFHYIFITPCIISYVIGFYYLSTGKENIMESVNEKPAAGF